MATMVVFTLACAKGGGIRPADTTVARREALADTLKQLISAAYDFSTPGSVDRMMSLFAPGARVLSASDGAITISRDSINAGISRFWEDVGVNMRNPVWKWGDVYVEPLGKDAAALTASWSIPHHSPNGEPHVLSGAWTAVFVRTPAGWRVVQEHLSAR